MKWGHVNKNVRMKKKKINKLESIIYFYYRNKTLVYEASYNVFICIIRSSNSSPGIAALFLILDL